MQCGKRGQISVEYLVIIGFVALAMIPLTYIYYTYTKDSSDEIVVSQLSQLTQEIAEAAEAVYYLGEPSQKTIKVTIPSQVLNGTINGREVIYYLSSRTGLEDVYHVSNVNMTGQVPQRQGNYRIVVKAAGEQVNVSYQ